MSLLVICLFGFFFVIFTLPGAWRHNARRLRQRRRDWSMPEEPRKRDSWWWQKEPPHCLTAADYHEALDRHERDSAHHPPPMRPPSMRENNPHPYD